MLPVLGALVLQAAYGAVDLLVVGRFGSTSGLSAVSTGSQVLNLVTFVVTQLAMGVTVLIARYLGEKRPEQIGSVIGGAAVIFTLLSAVLFVGLVGFARPISVLMQAPAEAVDLTASYVRICGGGIFFIVAYNLFSAIFRGLGDSKSPLLFVLVACVVNIVGDLALVAGLGMDAAGAAIATVLAQAVSVVLAEASARGTPLAVQPLKAEPLAGGVGLDGHGLAYGIAAAAGAAVHRHLVLDRRLVAGFHDHHHISLQALGVGDAIGQDQGALEGVAAGGIAVIAAALPGDAQLGLGVVAEGDLHRFR